VAGFRKLAACIEEGVSEADLVRQVKTEMFRTGADGLLFVGLSLDDQSPYPHIEEPSMERRVRPGDVVAMDMGCIYRGYNADFARSYVCRRPRADEADVYRELCERQARLIERIQVGATAGDIYDQAAEEGTRAMGEFYFELCGHGLGLELHEGPVLRRNNPEPILAGMVICVELARWLVHPTRRLLHVEDTLIVTESGIECLTASLPRELLRCPQ
jgi:Xaa-Pro aminopeptidase/Xaa-Pro dipeptidase